MIFLIINFKPFLFIINNNLNIFVHCIINNMIKLIQLHFMDEYISFYEKKTFKKSLFGR